MFVVGKLPIETSPWGRVDGHLGFVSYNLGTESVICGQHVPFFPPTVRHREFLDGHSSYIRHHQMAELRLRASVIVINAPSFTSEVKNIIRLGSSLAKYGPAKGAAIRNQFRSGCYYLKFRRERVLKPIDWLLWSLAADFLTESLMWNFMTHVMFY